MAGYSGTPLPKKLGIAPSMRVRLVGEPDGFRSLIGLDAPGAIVAGPDEGPFDVVILFCPDRSSLDRVLVPAITGLRSKGGLWVAWPKKSSGFVTDLTEADVQSRGLAAGLVDNKVCAITEVWSGLRFVVRLADRPDWPHP